MATPSIPTPPGPLPLYAGMGAHLPLLVVRNATGCIVCRRPFLEDDEAIPFCQRCGTKAFHLACYISAVARAPEERWFWTTGADPDPDRRGLFLCPGCRS